MNVAGPWRPALHPLVFKTCPGWLSLEERATLARIADAAPPRAWEDGRLKTGYQKMSIRSVAGAESLIFRATAVLHQPTGWDALLIRYPPGSYVPPHKDPVDPAYATDRDVAHIRVNAVVRQSGGGGIFSVDRIDVDLEEGDAVVFRPDLYMHAVTPVEGERLLFSVGTYL